MILYQRASAQPLIAVAKSLDFLAGGNRQSSEQTQFAAPMRPGYLGRLGAAQMGFECIALALRGRQEELL
jgi:hypothetical protein